MTNLTKLELSENAISDISTLSGLESLKSLNLGHNRIPDCNSDISALSTLINLTHLNLNDNRVSDFFPLVANMGLGQGDAVDVRHNPLSVESLNTHVPALQSRGVEVQFDDRTPVTECLPIEPPDNSVDAGSSHTLQSVNCTSIDREYVRKINLVAFMQLPTWISMKTVTSTFCLPLLMILPAKRP